jgi:hypothetical protein
MEECRKNKGMSDGAGAAYTEVLVARVMRLFGFYCSSRKKARLHYLKRHNELCTEGRYLLVGNFRE